MRKIMGRNWKGAEGASELLAMFYFLICLVVPWACPLYDLCTSIKISLKKIKYAYGFGVRKS